MKRPETDLVAMVLPVLTIIGFVAASGTRNLLLIVPMAGVMLASIGYFLYSAWKARQPGPT